MSEKWTCILCGKSKFSRPYQPHNCAGGFRKRFGKPARKLGIESVFAPSNPCKIKENKKSEKIMQKVIDAH